MGPLANRRATIVLAALATALILALNVFLVCQVFVGD
jgi:Mn2+/Fe2+ NRAMP family transporter